jgi:N utilization substance protein B
MLFQWEMNREEPARIEASFWKNVRAEKATRAFANQLLEGAVARSEAIEELLTRHAQHWRLDRMVAVDRNILRLAVYELLSGAGTPPKVVINEAVELAKKFSSADAAPFINGILDAILKEASK